MKTNTALPTGDGFIRQPELLELIGLSPSTLLRLEQRGDFPHRIKLDQRSVGWSIVEVQRWMDERKNGRPLSKALTHRSRFDLKYFSSQSVAARNYTRLV